MQSQENPTSKNIAQDNQSLGTLPSTGMEAPIHEQHSAVQEKRSIIKSVSRNLVSSFIITSVQSISSILIHIGSFYPLSSRSENNVSSSTYSNQNSLALLPLSKMETDGYSTTSNTHVSYSSSQNTKKSTNDFLASLHETLKSKKKYSLQENALIPSFDEQDDILSSITAINTISSTDIYKNLNTIQKSDTNSISSTISSVSTSLSKSQMTNSNQASFTSSNFSLTDNSRDSSPLSEIFFEDTENRHPSFNNSHEEDELSSSILRTNFELLNTKKSNLHQKDSDTTLIIDPLHANINESIETHLHFENLSSSKSLMNPMNSGLRTFHSLHEMDIDQIYLKRTPSAPAMSKSSSLL